MGLILVVELGLVQTQRIEMEEGLVRSFQKRLNQNLNEFYQKEAYHKLLKTGRHQKYPSELLPSGAHLEAPHLHPER